MRQIAVTTWAAASEAIAVDFVDDPLGAIDILEACWINRTALAVACGLVDGSLDYRDLDAGNLLEWTC